MLEIDEKLRKKYIDFFINDLNAFELSNAVGKNDIKVIGITDQGFYRLLMDQKRK